MKIKYTVIGNFVHLTQSETKLALYIARIACEETGGVAGLYYRDAMDECGFCKQSFYNALHGLLAKGVITAEKNSDIDYDAVLVDNEFPWKGDAKVTYADGYISLARDAFQTESFQKLKSHEKYLLLEFLKRTYENGHSYCISREKFMQQWSSVLGVTWRTLHGYLQKLKEFFSICLKDGKYYITCIESKFRKPVKGSPDYRAQQAQSFDQMVRSACNRNGVSYTKDALYDVSGLIGQYRNLAGSVDHAAELITECIASAADGIARKERKLDARQIHRLLADRIRGDGSTEKQKIAERKGTAEGQRKLERQRMAGEQRLKIQDADTDTDTGKTENQTAVNNSQDSRDSTPLQEQNLISDMARIKPVQPKRNAFHNFDQRNYDWGKMEALLLNDTSL